MEMNSVEALLVEQLKDLYSAEGQLLKALPKMARAASDPTLREAFETHLEETQGHLERLQEIGESLGMKMGGKKCKAMEGLIEEGNEVFEMEGDESIIDAALIAAAQRIEHYEISAYGTARTLAERVGEQQLVDLLQQTLDEEYATDEKLTQICEGELLANATVRAGMVEDEGEEDSDFVGQSGEFEEEGSSNGRGGSRSRSQSRGSSSRSGSSGGNRGGGGGNGRSSRGSSSSSRSGSSSRGGSGGGRSRSSSGGSSRGGSSSRSGSSSGSRSGGNSSRGGSGGNRSRSRSSSGSRSGSGSSR